MGEGDVMDSEPLVISSDDDDAGDPQPSPARDRDPQPSPARDRDPSQPQIFDFFAEFANTAKNIDSNRMKNQRTEKEEPVDFIDLSFDENDKVTKCHTPLERHASSASSGVYSLTGTDAKSDDDDDTIVLDYLPLPDPKKKRKINPEKARKPRGENGAEKERLKALKKAVAAEKKSLRPGECLKHMLVEIGSNILNKPAADEISEVLNSNGIRSVSDSSSAPEDCIGWKREISRSSKDEDGKLKTTRETIDEPFLLYVPDVQEMERLLLLKSLNSHVRFLKESSRCQVTILLYAPKTYFKSRKKTDAKRKSASDKRLTEDRLENCITELLFEESVSCYRVNSPAEMALMVLHFTKSIAEAPHKKIQEEVDEQADFFLRGEKKCVAVDKDGNGLKNLWRQTFTKFPMATLETAHAICDKFPSPASLIKTLSQLSKEEGIKLLAEINILRTKGPSSTSRRLGPELAKKIYTFYMATDGSEKF